MLMNLLSSLPDSEKLLNWFKKNNPSITWLVNGHIHSPYSFSAFKSIEDMFKKAKEENIKVLGINDFNVTDGYKEFYELSLLNKVFPLFNIEFITLSKDFQQKGILVNDPNNPGRTYFSGKGLKYPLVLEKQSFDMVSRLKNNSQKHIQKMTIKLNSLLNENKLGISLSYNEVKKYSKELVRERHIATALRKKIFDKYSDSEGRKRVLSQIYGKECKADLKSNAEIENEIRSNLLKSGGQAFVAEDENSFLELPAVQDFIINAGGIPCYPLLLDFGDKNFTDFEINKEKLHKQLIELNVYCIEFIPRRNTLNILTEYVRYFRKHGFLVLFGTEHNTPAMEPLQISCKDKPLNDELKQVSYEGACVAAAHQYLVANNKPGYIDKKGTARTSDYKDLYKLGDAVINYFLNI